MSKKNHKPHYTPYSQIQQSAPVVEAPVETEEEVVVPVTEETPVAPVVDDESEGKYGVVTACEKLNVRKAPNASASIVTTLDVDTEVMIDETESTDGFYKIYTGSGIEGYCMKQFIKVD